MVQLPVTLQVVKNSPKLHDFLPFCVAVIAQFRKACRPQTCQDLQGRGATNKYQTLF